MFSYVYIPVGDQNKSMIQIYSVNLLIKMIWSECQTRKKEQKRKKEKKENETYRPTIRGMYTFCYLLDKRRAICINLTKTC